MPKWSELKESLRLLFSFLDDLIDPLPSPGAPVVVSHREVFTTMSTGSVKKQFGYTIAHPDLQTPNDVLKVRLYASIDGAVQPPVDLDPGSTHEVIADEGQKVDIHFTAFDGTNESPDSPVLSFTAVDDVPPDAPGAPTVASHREILDGGTTPTPAPAPTPVDPNAPVTPAPAPTDPNAPVTPAPTPADPNAPLVSPAPEPAPVPPPQV